MHVDASALRSIREFSIGISPGQRCPYCHGGVRETHDLVGCPDCLVVLHASCTPEGRCTTLGCSNGPRPREGATSGGSKDPLGARPRLRRWVRWVLAVGFLCLGAGFWATYRIFVCYPPEEIPYPLAVAPTLFLEADGQLRDARDGWATLSGRVQLSMPEGYPGADLHEPLVVEVAGQRATVGASRGYNVRVSISTFSARIPARAGWQAVPVIATWGGGEVHQQVRVFLSSYAAPDPEPLVQDLRVPTRVDSDLLFVEGQVVPELEWATVTISGPMGEVVLERQPPGPFTGAVTLPGPGRHQVRVVITDPRGQRQVFEQVVVR
jgi:hypothetical protein